MIKQQNKGWRVQAENELTRWCSRCRRRRTIKGQVLALAFARMVGLDVFLLGDVALVTLDHDILSALNELTRLNIGIEFCDRHGDKRLLGDINKHLLERGVVVDNAAKDKSAVAILVGLAAEGVGHLVVLRFGAAHCRWANSRVGDLVLNVAEDNGAKGREPVARGVLGRKVLGIDGLHIVLGETLVTVPELVGTDGGAVDG